jgi:hypothetical protein
MNPLQIMNKIGDAISSQVQKFLLFLDSKSIFTSVTSAKLSSIILLLLVLFLFNKTVKTVSAIVRWGVVIIILSLVATIGVSII